VTWSAIRWQQHAIVGVAGLFFGLIALAPLVWPMVGLLGRPPAEWLRNIEVLQAAQPWILLVRSLGLSTAVVIGALLVGTPLGLLLGRTNIAGRRVLLVVHAFPMFLPPFLLALG
jgi:ABC-type Fe3+ transport system permease subunit